MPDVEPLPTLPAAAVEAVLAATGRSAPLAPTLIEALAPWLTEEYRQAIRRARTKPLTKADVDRLENAHARFLTVIEELQDRTLPPPRVPISDGATAWQEWREIYEQFGFIGGRRESSDWLLIGALLALYETVSGRSASAAQPRGPTMRFLEEAMRELANHAPDELRSNFASPNAEALKKRLPGLNRLALWHAKRRLEKLIGPARE